MENKLLNIQIEIDLKSTPEGQPNLLKGKAILKSKETLTIQSMNVYLNQETKGKMTPNQYVMKVVNLINYRKQISRDEIYSFPFEFSTEELEESFTGTNGAILHNVEVGIDVSPEDIDRVKPGFFSKLGRIVSNDNSIRYKQYFKYKDPTKKYFTGKSDVLIKRKPIMWLVFVMGVFISPIILYFLPNLETMYVIFGIGASMLLAYVLQLLYMEFSVTEILLHKNDGEDNAFEIVLNSAHKDLDNKLKFYYEVVEKVRDTTGTSTVTHSSVLYVSEKKTYKKSLDGSGVVLRFPTNRQIPCTAVGDYSIIWVLCATMKDSFGLTATYESNFYVYRE